MKMSLASPSSRHLPGKYLLLQLTLSVSLMMRLTLRQGCSALYAVKRSSGMLA